MSRTRLTGVGLVLFSCGHMTQWEVLSISPSVSLSVRLSICHAQVENMGVCGSVWEYVCVRVCVCVVVVVVESRLRPTRLTGVGLILFMVRLHSPSYLDILSGYQYPDILHSEFTKFTTWIIWILISKWNIRLSWLHAFLFIRTLFIRTSASDLAKKLRTS